MENGFYCNEFVLFLEPEGSTCIDTACHLLSNVRFIIDHSLKGKKCEKQRKRAKAYLWGENGGNTCVQVPPHQGTIAA